MGVILFVISMVVGVKQGSFFPLITISLICLISYTIMHFLKLYYISFAHYSNKITIRYHYAHPLLHRPQAIEILSTTLIKADLSKSLFGKKYTLLLGQYTPQGMALSPPLYITAMPPRLRKEMVNTLNQLATENLTRLTQLLNETQKGVK